MRYRGAMEPTLSRRQVQEVDRRAMRQLGMPGIVLMENAARNAADVVLSLIKEDLHLEAGDCQAGVLCGGGHNGGDGYALARHLHNHGVVVTLYAARPVNQLQGDARTNADICLRLGLSCVEVAERAAVVEAARRWPGHQVMVDALLGTGFSGEVREPLASLIAHCNAVRREHGTAVVAVDVPSGLDCDTGEPASPTIQADVTVTFVARKSGFRSPQAQRVLGRVVVADIGVPWSWVAEVVRTIP